MDFQIGGQATLTSATGSVGLRLKSIKKRGRGRIPLAEIGRSQSSWLMGNDRHIGNDLGITKRASVNTVAGYGHYMGLWALSRCSPPVRI